MSELLCAWSMDEATVAPWRYRPPVDIGADTSPRDNAGMAARRGPSLAATVCAFAALGVTAVAIVALFTGQALRNVADDEALRDARQLTRATAVSVIEPDLTDGVLRNRPSALRRLDAAVRSRVLVAPVMRVKLWALDGRIVYSDVPALTGRRFSLGREERAAVHDGRVVSDISDASKPENAYERGLGRLLEVYLPVLAPNGRRLLYEQYLRYGAVTESGRRRWLRLLPAVGGALLVLALAQLPLAWWLARRLKRREDEREALLLEVVEASDRERRELAQTLHEGPVQALAGLAWQLGAAARRAPEPERGELDTAAAHARDALRDLRTALVTLHPPNLHRSGLPAALADLAASLHSAGTEVELDLDLDAAGLGPAAEKLVYRVAAEGLRNAARHAAATRVTVSLERRDDRARLTVTDDGRGFAPERLDARRSQGHRGLALLQDLAAESGARLEIESAPDHGTRLLLEAPAR
jgi:signal transduction histidine kinase